MCHCTAIENCHTSSFSEYVMWHYIQSKCHPVVDMEGPGKNNAPSAVSSRCARLLRKPTEASDVLLSITSGFLEVLFNTCRKPQKTFRDIPSDKRRSVVLGKYEGVITPCGSLLQGVYVHYWHNHLGRGLYIKFSFTVVILLGPTIISG